MGAKRSGAPGNQIKTSDEPSGIVSGLVVALSLGTEKSRDTIKNPSKTIL